MPIVDRPRAGSSGNAGSRVLLVEDHDIVRRGLRLLLEDEFSCEVVEASSAADAIPWATGGTVDLVLLDVRLHPGQDGLWALGQIRAVCPELPVLVMSTFEDPDAVQAAVDGGAQGYLIKDASLTQLREAIDIALSGRGLYLHPSVAHVVIARRRQVERYASLLSEREASVLRYLVDGYGNDEIAGRLFLSAKTVKAHLSAIFRKLGVANRTQAVAKALREHIVDLPEPAV